MKGMSSAGIILVQMFITLRIHYRRVLRGFYFRQRTFAAIFVAFSFIVALSMAFIFYAFLCPLRCGVDFGDATFIHFGVYFR